MWSAGVSASLGLPVLLTMMALSGCATVNPVQTSSVNGGLNCIDDSATCLAKRRAALTEIMADKSGKWVERPPSANADASGVRLFAFKQRKRELNCRQLRIGYVEASSAPARLRASKNPQMTPARISRGAILGEEVARELKKEIRRRRCKPVKT